MEPDGIGLTAGEESAMASQKSKLIIVPKEKAVFWMDKNGNWHNEHGKFEHPKIIKYFNASIKKDEIGYYVHQVSDAVEERVYFPFEDTALFVVDLRIRQEDISLVLNTTEVMRFDPEQLFVRDDNLYVHTRDHWIKFSSMALVKMSRFMEEKNGQLFLTVNGKTSLIQ
jgi:hypothetical protein